MLADVPPSPDGAHFIDVVNARPSVSKESLYCNVNTWSASEPSGIFLGVSEEDPLESVSSFDARTPVTERPPLDKPLSRKVGLIQWVTDAHSKRIPDHATNNLRNFREGVES